MQKNNETNKPKAWIIAADMGYGHQRTAFPLRFLAPDMKVVNANHYDGIPKKDRAVWQTTRNIYEFISRLKMLPFVGNFIFLIIDRFQKILSYYPKRDLSRPNLTLKNIINFIKKGWGKDLISKLKSKDIPIVSTFFTPAFMAEHFKYPGDIYCVVCDADVSRTWVPIHPKNSRLKYFAPCTWVRDRLKTYGVKPENIFLTGFPLPKENLGTEKLEIVKNDLRNRIVNLDPLWRYRKMYKPLLDNYLGDLPANSDHPLTILFSIGGAGAQKEIPLHIVECLRRSIKNEKLRIIISVGVRTALAKYYSDRISGLELDGWVHILSGRNMVEYFEEFNKALRQTDILWTKPSELSFYAGLGIPIIIAPCIGSQEEFNRRWLLHIGAGMVQEDPKYTDQWLFDMLYAGDFAEMAMQGFVEIKKEGVFNIEKIISGQCKLKIGI